MLIIARWPRGVGRQFTNQRTAGSNPSVSFYFFLHFCQTLTENSQFRRICANKGLCLSLSTNLRGTFGLGPIHVAPRSSKENEAENGTFHYEKDGPDWVRGSNPRLSKSFLNL